MAENHYVDAKDQHEAASGIEDHSDLTTFYSQAKQKELGPWMQEADRQASLKAERDKIQTGLRKSAVLIGLCVSLPIALGILLGKLAISKVDSVDVTPVLFLLGLLGIGLLIMTIVLLKWVEERFQRHSIRALPITLTTLLSLLLVTQKEFAFFESTIRGLAGYVAALVALIAIAIVIVTVTIFAWTSPKLSSVIKTLILLVFLGAATIVFYLA